MNEPSTALSHGTPTAQYARWRKPVRMLLRIVLWIMLIAFTFVSLGIWFFAFALKSDFRGGTEYLFLAMFASVLWIYVFILSIRNDHAIEVYLLWFVYFFTAYCGFLIFYFLDANDIIQYDRNASFPSIPKVSTLETGRAWSDSVITKAISWYIDITINVEDEVIVFALILGGIVLPQIVGFLIGGLFGCAALPILLSRTSSFAIIMLIKGLCALSALHLAAGLFSLYNHEMAKTQIYYISSSLFLITLSFMLTTIYYRVRGIIRDIIKRDVFLPVIVYMTRFTYPQTEPVQQENDRRHGRPG
jgi:hypothetical protein